MSEQGKQQVGNVMTWLFRALTGIGAFFLMQTYSGITRSQEVMEEIRNNQTKTDTYVRVKLEQHDLDISRQQRELEFLRNTREATPSRRNQ